MATKNSKRPDVKVVRDIAKMIHLLVEAREGPQKYIEREIDYALYAALLMVDAATRHQSNVERVDSFRAAAAKFADIAEIDYVERI